MFWALNLTSFESISRKESGRGSWSRCPAPFFTNIPHPASRLFISAFLNPVFCVYSLVWNSHLLPENVTWHIWVVTIFRIYDRHVKKPTWSAHNFAHESCFCVYLAVKSRFLSSCVLRFAFFRIPHRVLNKSRTPKFTSSLCPKEFMKQ